MKKPDIVILHGWGLSSQKFEPLTAALRKRGYQVTAPDLPGFGSSAPPSRPYALSDYVLFVHNFIQESGIQHPILLGHSFGGRVSLLYEKLYPQEIRALVLTGTPGFSPVARKRLLFFVVLAKAGKLFFSIPPMSFFKGSVQKWYYYVVGAREFYRAEGHMRETFKKIVQEDLVSAMKVVSVPTLLLWGKEDIIVPLAIARRMEERIPGAKLVVIPHTDHGVPFKNPVVFVDYVEQFLRNV